MILVRLAGDRDTITIRGHQTSPVKPTRTGGLSCPVASKETVIEVISSSSFFGLGAMPSPSVGHGALTSVVYAG
jgi:hypothetical protein